jgi:hypothetical protein
MEITFNLKNAKILIPSGRLMNLKDLLGWKDLEINKKAMQQFIDEGISETYNMTLDFGQNLTQKVKYFMSLSNQNNRKYAYEKLAINNLSINELLDNKVSQISNDSLSENKNLVTIIGQEILNIDKVQEKLLKLKKLKQINNM